MSEDKRGREGEPGGFSEAADAARRIHAQPQPFAARRDSVRGSKGGSVRIELDDLTRPEIHALLREHLQNMYEITPAKSVHALDLAKLRAPDITFWSVWEGDTLMGCGALREIDKTHGEIKSMRTPAKLRRRGAGRAVLTHIIEEARRRGYQRLSLETGAMAPFRPAQLLYESFGFSYCGPFAGYAEDANSVFMTKVLS